ncbi:MAG: hypothetical protein WC141_03220 [Arcobacteraceae bacterium]
MAKGKKVAVKEIKRVNENIVLVNGKEYILLEACEDVESAITMKISSNGNRLLRFKDENKKASLDVKRDIDIVKYTFKNAETAKKFAKTNDKTMLEKEAIKEVIDNANSYSRAKIIIADFTNKKSKNYDGNEKTFYLSEESI